MPRAREFDRDEALAAAMSVFWRKGYGETNISDLVEASGVARYGWYSAVGDKDAIFLAALERYREHLNRRFLDKLRAPGADFAAIEAHLRLNLNAAPRGAWKGCFACASASERGGADKRVAAAVGEVLGDARSAVRNAMKNAVRKGQVRDLPIDTLVEFSVGAMHHLSTLVRSGAPRKEVEAFVDSSLALLRP